MSGATSAADLDEAPARTIYLNQPQQSKFRDNWVRYGAVPASPFPGGSPHTPQPWAGRARVPLSRLSTLPTPAFNTIKRVSAEADGFVVCGGYQGLASARANPAAARDELLLSTVVRAGSC